PRWLLRCRPSRTYRSPLPRRGQRRPDSTHLRRRSGHVLHVLGSPQPPPRALPVPEHRSRPPRLRSRALPPPRVPALCSLPPRSPPPPPPALPVPAHTSRPPRLRSRPLPPHRVPALCSLPQRSRRDPRVPAPWGRMVVEAAMGLGNVHS